MSEEPSESNNNGVWKVVIGLIVVVAGFTLAIIKDEDLWALGSCILIGIVSSIHWDGDDKREIKAGSGLVTALSLFFLWMAVKFIIASA